MRENGMLGGGDEDNASPSFLRFLTMMSTPWFSVLIQFSTCTLTLLRLTKIRPLLVVCCLGSFGRKSRIHPDRPVEVLYRESLGKSNKMPTGNSAVLIGRLMLQTQLPTKNLLVPQVPI